VKPFFFYFVRRKLQLSVSESSKQEDFSHLASIKALVTDMEALKENVRRSSHLLEVLKGFCCLDSYKFSR
jgi:hypothetical protein